MSRANENATITSRFRSAIGALITSDEDSLETLDVGTNGQVLTVDDTAELGIKWADPASSGFSAGQITDLTDGGASTLHYHASDRALENATGTLAVSAGGTGQTTASAAINALVPSQTSNSGKFLTTNGTAVSWGSGGSGVGDVSGPASSTDNTIPLFDGTTGKLLKGSTLGLPTTAVVGIDDAQTLTNKTIGSGSTWSGNEIGLAKGGTGQSSWTKGDILYSSATNTLNKLPIGTVGQSLVVSASGLPSWTTNTLVNNEVNILDYGAVANFVLGPGSTKISGTDNSTAVNSALATGRPIYVPAGNYYVANSTTITKLNKTTWYGPGKIYVNSSFGYIELGKMLVVGSCKSHELGATGGLLIGGDNGTNGVRQWMGHHNWMQLQPTGAGAPMQFQLYSSATMCTAIPQNPNRLNAVYGSFDTAELFVGDYIGWNGQLYVIASVTSSYITVTKAFVGGSPGWATNNALEKPVYKSYETASGICNTSGTTVTYVSGEQFIHGGSWDHAYIIINGTKYTASSGPNWDTAAGKQILTLSTSAGTQTGVAYKLYRQYAPWSYVALQRWQGITGSKEATGTIWLNTRNEFCIAGQATHDTLLPNIRIEAPRIRIGGGEQYPYDGSTSWYGIEVVAPMTSLSYGAHFVRLGGFDGHEAVKVITWDDHTDHLTLYGSVSGVNDGPAIFAEGSSTNLDLMFAAKGSGHIRFGTKTSSADAAVNGYITIKDSAGNIVKLATIA